MRVLYVYVLLKKRITLILMNIFNIKKLDRKIKLYVLKKEEI